MNDESQNEITLKWSKTSMEVTENISTRFFVEQNRKVYG